MPKRDETGGRIVAAWRTSDRATTYLIEHLPVEIWSEEVPGCRLPRRVTGGIWQWTTFSRILAPGGRR